MSRELDAKVADLVMGLRTCEVRVRSGTNTVKCYYDEDANKPLDGGWYGSELQHHFGPDPYTTEPAADYSVLVRVRETWKGGDMQARWRWQAFNRELRLMWGSRLTGSWTHLEQDGEYLPGDYSKAALAALGAT